MEQARGPAKVGEVVYWAHKRTRGEGERLQGGKGRGWCARVVYVEFGQWRRTYQVAFLTRNKSESNDYLTTTILYSPRLLKLQTELKQLAAELASVESMYKMSDPDGLYDESKRKDIKRREKQKEREKILLESREKTAELPADVGNSNDPYSSVRDPSLGDVRPRLTVVHSKLIWPAVMYFFKNLI